MAVSTREHRERLFDLYSKHATLYLSDLRDVFVCPLCPEGVGYTRQALTASEPQVTLAHIIPQSAGGRACTLVCKHCNNRVGHDLEASLLEWLTFDDLNAGAGKLNGRLAGQFGDIGVEWEFSPQDRTCSIYGVPALSNKSKMEALDNYLKACAKLPGTPIEFSLTHRKPLQPLRIERALYHSAFLLMFRYFGYEFAFHPHFELLREQVRQPEQDVWKTAVVTLGQEQANHMIGPGRYAILFLPNPSVIVCALRLRTKARRERAHAVVLPGMDEAMVPRKISGKFAASRIPYRPQALLEEKHYLQRLWRSVSKGTC